MKVEAVAVRKITPDAISILIIVGSSLSISISQIIIPTIIAMKFCHR